MEEKKMTERESLELITEMISRTKKRYVDDGSALLLWGYVTLAVSVLVWVLLVKTGNQAYNWLWNLIWIIGCIGSFIMSKMKKESFGAKSYSDKITSQLWTVMGLVVLTVFVCCMVLTFLKIDTWRAMLIFPLIVVPLTEIAQGIVVKESSLVAGGAIGIAVGIVTVCCVCGGIGLGVNWFIPMFIVAFIGMSIVPGHILNHKARVNR